MTIILEEIGPYPVGGFEDEDGVEHFNDRVRTPYGLLGNLLVDFDGEVPVIVRADPVVLIRRGFPDEWTAPTTGVTIEQNPLGFKLFQLDARNGMVRYRLDDSELIWKGSTPEFNQKFAVQQLGVLSWNAWTPEKEAPERVSNVVTTWKSDQPIPANVRGQL